MVSLGVKKTIKTGEAFAKKVTDVRAVYSGAGVIPVTEPATCPIQSQASIEWRQPRCAGK